MSSEIYLLVGINLAIFFGFTAIYAIMEARRRRKGVKGLDVGLKPQGAQNKSAGDNPPKNAKLCGICNAPNPPNQKFCIECGFRL